MSGGPGHLGERLSALVDGQLDHADRDRVLAHLARCAECRREAAEQRALKARLDRLDVHAPGGLQSRLLALPAGHPGWPAATGPAPSPVPSPVGFPAGGSPGATRPSRLRPPTAALGALLLLAVGAGLLGPASDEDGTATPRRDPNRPGLVVEHATATSQVPLSDPAVVGAAWTSTPAPGAPPHRSTTPPRPARQGTGGGAGTAGAVVPVGAPVRDR